MEYIQLVEFLLPHVAVGGVAYGHIAIGDKVKGAIEFANNNFKDITSEEVKSVI